MNKNENVNSFIQQIHDNKIDIESGENFWITMHQSAKNHGRSNTSNEAVLLLLENQARLIVRIETLENCLDILLNNLKSTGLQTE